VKNEEASCVLLADRHHGLRDGIRGLLQSVFDVVFMVADEASLLEGVGRLNPAIAVVDLSLSGGDLSGFLGRLATLAPGTRVVLLSTHDERSVAASALKAGASALVLKRDLVTDLIPAIEAVVAGQTYVSPGASR
jgi:DNA-binding NarL/FixJ family response regulator